MGAARAVRRRRSGRAPLLAPGLAFEPFFHPGGDGGAFFGGQVRKVACQRLFGAQCPFGALHARGLDGGDEGLVIEGFGAQQIGQGRGHGGAVPALPHAAPRPVAAAGAN